MRYGVRKYSTQLGNLPLPGFQTLNIASYGHKHGHATILPRTTLSRTQPSIPYNLDFANSCETPKGNEKVRDGKLHRNTT